MHLVRIVSLIAFNFSLNINCQFQKRWGQQVIFKTPFNAEDNQKNKIRNKDSFHEAFVKTNQKDKKKGFPNIEQIVQFKASRPQILGKPWMYFLTFFSILSTIPLFYQMVCVRNVL